MFTPAQAKPFERPYRCLFQTYKQFHLYLVGCGGTGSHLAQAIGALLYHLRNRDDMAAQATFIDGDHVEPKNVGRQRFCEAEIGRNKAATLATRLNMAYGLKINAVPSYLSVERFSRWGAYNKYGACHLLIGAVDNAIARQAMATLVKRSTGSIWWLDCGNAEFNGQILVGNRSADDAISAPDLNLGLISDLPAPSWQEPGLLDSANDAPDAQDCALAVAHEEQSLMINTLSAAVAAQYLYQIVVQRELKMMATYFNGQPPIMRSTVLTQSSLAPFWAKR